MLMENNTEIASLHPMRVSVHPMGGQVHTPGGLVYTHTKFTPQLRVLFAPQGGLFTPHF